jgi:hypothetical protein
MASDSDKIKLLEFLLKLEADSAFLKEFVEEKERSRSELVAQWEFGDENIASALVEMDSKALQDYLNPTAITIKGWVKAPPGGP